jgi:hypothetical protein
VAYPPWNVFPHYLINGKIFIKGYRTLNCVLIFSTTVVWNISHSRKNWARYYPKYYIGLHVILSNINETWIFSTDFRKILQISNFMKMRLVEAEFFHADRRTDMTKLVVAFRRFANEPKNCSLFKTKPEDKHDFRLPPLCKWDQRSFGILRSVEWYFHIDVSGQPIGPIIKGQAVQEECRRHCNFSRHFSWTAWFRTLLTVLQHFSLSGLRNCVWIGRTDRE